MSATTENELGVPEDASLPESTTSDNGEVWVLRTSGGPEIPLSKETSIRSPSRCLLVGRKQKVADIRIQHGSISRHHAALYFQGTMLTLQDFGSKFGTLLNGERVQGKHVLNDGDILIFGNVRTSQFTVFCKKADPKTTDNEQVNAKPLTEPGHGLSGRAKREAEIAALMQSLDEAPTYRAYVAPASTDNTKDLHPTLANNDPTNKQNKVAEKFQLPISDRLVLERQSDERRHVVTSLAIDPSGARFVVGATNSTLRFYDFAGMDQLRTTPFKTVDVDEGHAISSVCYSNTGDRILVGSGGLQPCVLDRDGYEIIKFVRGDMYVTDQARTSGHTAATTGVHWHPLERDVVLTSSMDGSARLWNLNGKTQFQMLVCAKVFQPKSRRGQRTGVQCVCFHPSGREFAVGTVCGSLQIWKTAGVASRPQTAIFDVHGQGNPINFVKYSHDGLLLATRSSGDDSCMIWDARRMSASATPKLICRKVPSAHEHCTCAFSPDGTVVCVGTAERQRTTEGGKKGEFGRLVFFRIPKVTKADEETRPIMELTASNEYSIVVVHWHAKLNQIFLGFSDGSVMVYFDRTLSEKGALLVVRKAGRRTDELSLLLNSRAPTGSAGVRGEIVTPNALNSRSTTNKKRKLEKDTAEEALRRRPEPPAAGIKTGGKGSAAVNFTQFIVDSTMGAKKTIAGKDPREALFKYQEGKNYINQAYVGNKEVILADTTVEQEEEEMEKKRDGSSRGA